MSTCLCPQHKAVTNFALSHCPAALRSVILLGSWDNFTGPYPLELDVRRGHNFWRGCFTFSDVICDGDLDDLTTKRNGPLKMGGTYWYYVSKLTVKHSHVTDVDYSTRWTMTMNATILRNRRLPFALFYPANVSTYWSCQVKLTAAAVQSRPTVSPAIQVIDI